MQFLRSFLFPLALIFTLAALGIPAEVGAANDAGFERALEKARKNLSKKKYEKAIPYFVQANALAGGSCQECLQGLGIAARRTQDPELALHAYEQWLHLGGDTAFDALQRLIPLSLRVGDPLRGAAACRVFLQTREKGERQAAWALNELGLLLVASGDVDRLEEAVSAFHAALERNHHASEILRINAAEIQWRLGREDEARALLHDLSLEEQGLSPGFREIPYTTIARVAGIRSRLRDTEQRREARPTGWSVNVPSAKRWREVENLGTVDAVLAHLTGKIGIDAPVRERAVACAAGVAAEELNARLFQAGWPGPFLGSTAVTRPKVVHAAQPEYNDEARKARIQGRFRLMIVIDESGRVPYAIGFNSLPMGLKEKGIEAAYRWRFEPAKREGREISVCENIDIDFRL